MSGTGAAWSISESHSSTKERTGQPAANPHFTRASRARAGTARLQQNQTLIVPPIEFRIACADCLKLSWTIAALAVSSVVVAILMASSGPGLDILGKGSLIYLLILAVFALIRYRFRFADQGTSRFVRDFAEYTGLFIFVSLLCAAASYLLAAASSGYSDPVLARIDALLQFNWLAWYELVAAHPALQTAGRIAYANIYFSPLILMAAFAHSGARERAQCLLVSFWLAAIITLTLFVTMPAVGPLSYLWQGPIPYMPTSGTFQADLLPALRDRSSGLLDLGNLEGLVCAPSFHSTSAILYMVMGWGHRKIRWPLIGLNSAMLLATPVEGTHYLIDMIGGVFVAIVALGLTSVTLSLLSGKKMLISSGQSRTPAGALTA